MAKEAIKSIKDAEETVKIMLKEAQEASVKSREEASLLAEEEYEKILFEAETMAQGIKQASIEEGELTSQPIIEKGREEAEAILELKNDKLDEAVSFITRRVVSVNGNS